MKLYKVMAVSTYTVPNDGQIEKEKKSRIVRRDDIYEMFNNRPESFSINDRGK